MRILIAEDDGVSRRLLEVALAQLGHDVTSCADGTRAWGNYRLASPQIAILDWMMPGMDGPEVCRRIREAEKQHFGDYCYIIFLTVLSSTDDLVRGMETGADDFITKPFDRRELEVRIQAGARILDLRDQLVEASKSRAEFVNMAIHDFGTPISIIRSYLELFRDELMGELNPRQRTAVHRMLAAEQTIESLRRDMLELARFDHGVIELAKEPADLLELAESCVAEVEPLLRSKDQRVSVRVPGLEVVCDRRRIRQAISNYLGNAVRYTGEHGRISVSAERENGHVRVSVADTGRGIAAEDITKVFDGFFRSGARVAGSTGLGLAVVRKVVEAHGGRAWCESRLGEGSTFHFTIPIAAA